MLLIALVFKSYSEVLNEYISYIMYQTYTEEFKNRKWNYQKQEMESSKQEMELTKQEMDLFLLFSYLRTKNSFYKLFCIFTMDLSAWKKPVFETGNGIIQTGNGIIWGNYCHTRLHLGFSAKLRIWQVPICKMEPLSGIIITLVMISPSSSYYKPLLLLL